MEAINRDVPPVDAEAGPWLGAEVYYQPVGMDGKWIHFGSYHTEEAARVKAAEIIQSRNAMGVKVEPL